MIHPKVVVPRFPCGIRRVRTEPTLVPAGTAALLGVVGALLAIPVAAAVLLVIRQVAIPRMDQV